MLKPSSFIVYTNLKTLMNEKSSFLRVKIRKYEIILNDYLDMALTFKIKNIFVVYITKKMLHN